MEQTDLSEFQKQMELQKNRYEINIKKYLNLISRDKRCTSLEKSAERS